MNSPAPVMRVARRRARPGCREAYEALARGMIEDASKYPGFLGADLLPPDQQGGEHRIVTRFASEADMQRWNASAERRAWHERMRPVAEGDPEFRVLTGLEAWTKSWAARAAKALQPVVAMALGDAAAGAMEEAMTQFKARCAKAGLSV